MKSTSEYLLLLKQFKETKGKFYGIQKIGLFGSVARGEHKEGSDVDVCFEGIPKGFFAVGGIKYVKNHAIQNGASRSGGSGTGGRDQRIDPSECNFLLCHRTGGSYVRKHTVP